MDRSFIIDSGLIIGWLKDQSPAADVMDRLWGQARNGTANLQINVMNLGEVFYVTARARGSVAAETVLANLRARPLGIVSVPDALVLEAARLKARYPISYADAFAAATAIEHRLPLVTGDPEFRRLEADGLLRLEWIG